MELAKIILWTLSFSVLETNSEIIIRQFLQSPTMQAILENKPNFMKIFENVKEMRLLIRTRSISSEFLKTFPGKSFQIFNINYDSIDLSSSCHEYVGNYSHDFKNEVLFYEQKDDVGRRKRDIIEYDEDTDNNDFFVLRNLWNTVNVESGYVVETNGYLFDHMLDCLVNPLGIFLFVFRTRYNSVLFPGSQGTVTTTEATRLITELDILESLRGAWKNIGAVKIFIYFRNRVLAFNPFIFNNQTESYGILAEFNRETYVMENFLNLHSYPLRLELFPSAFTLPVTNSKTKKIVYFKGADAEVVNILKKKMNFKTKILPPHPDSFGYKLVNGSFTGSIGRMLRHESDLAITGFFLKDYLTRDIEFSVVMGSDQLCCVVQKAKRIPPFIVPLSCFEPLLWLLLLITIIVSASFWMLVRKANESETLSWQFNQGQLNFKNPKDRFNRSMRNFENPHYQYLQIFVDSFILTVSAPLRRFSEVGSERFLIASLCIISLVFSSIFQSTLATVFIKPSYYKDILSLPDLDKSNLRIGLKYQAILDDIFPSNTTNTIESLKKKLYLVENKKLSLMSLIAATGSMSTATRRTTLSLDNAIFIRNQSLFMVPECPRTYGLAYVFPRHSVLMDRINLIILYLLNGGIIEKFIADMYYNQTWIDKTRYGPPVYIPKFKVLTINELQLPYFILCTGVILSSVIFGIEQFSVKWKRRNRIRKRKRNPLKKF